eukprot:Em0012g240a
MLRIKVTCRMQEEDTLEGFVDNIDDPYDRCLEEPDDQQQLQEDYDEEDTPNGCDITISRLSQIWFDHQLLRELLTRVNDALPGEQISIKELFQFLMVELFLNVYRCSPTMFYHPMARKLYPTAEMCMPHARYQVILKALSQKQKVTDAGCRSSGDDTWMRPMALDREIIYQC